MNKNKEGFDFLNACVFSSAISEKWKNATCPFSPNQRNATTICCIIYYRSHLTVPSSFLLLFRIFTNKH